eukprot:4679108-Pleurochrysis_carterae.AAC.1
MEGWQEGREGRTGGGGRESETGTLSLTPFFYRVNHTPQSAAATYMLLLINSCSCAIPKPSHPSYPPPLPFPHRCTPVAT